MTFLPSTNSVKRRNRNKTLRKKNGQNSHMSGKRQGSSIKSSKTQMSRLHSLQIIQLKDAWQQNTG